MINIFFFLTLVLSCNDDVIYDCEIDYMVNEAAFDVPYNDDHVFDYYPVGNSVGTLIYFHGGGEEAAQTLTNNQLPPSLDCWRDLGYNIVYVEYSYTLEMGNEYDLQGRNFPLISDGKDIIRFIYENYDNRIYLYGYSFGGYIVQMLLNTENSYFYGDTYPVIAGASFAGVSDWRKSAGYYPTGLNGLDYDSTSPISITVPNGNAVSVDASFAWNWLGQMPIQDITEANFASPIMYIPSVPTYFAHGKNDRIVPYYHSQLAHQRFLDFGINSEISEGQDLNHFTITNCEEIGKSNAFFIQQSKYCNTL